MVSRCRMASRPQRSKKVVIRSVGRRERAAWEGPRVPCMTLYIFPVSARNGPIAIQRRLSKVKRKSSAKSEYRSCEAASRLFPGDGSLNNPTAYFACQSRLSSSAALALDGKGDKLVAQRGWPIFSSATQSPPEPRPSSLPMNYGPRVLRSGMTPAWWPATASAT
jgi:hypothetical protein